MLVPFLQDKSNSHAQPWIVLIVVLDGVPAVCLGHYSPEQLIQCWTFALELYNAVLEGEQVSIK